MMDLQSAAASVAVWLLWNLRRLRFSRLSIRAKLQLAVAVGAVVPLGIGLWQARLTIASGERKAGDDLERMLVDKESVALARLAAIRTSISTFGQNPTIQSSVVRGGWTPSVGSTWRDFTPDRLNELLPGVEAVRLVSLEGSQIWHATTYHALEAGDFAAKRDLAPLSASMTYSQAAWEFLSPTFFDTVAVTDEYGRRRGFLVAQIRASAIFSPDLLPSLVHTQIAVRHRYTGRLGPRLEALEGWSGGEHVSHGSATFLVRVLPMSAVPLDLVGVIPTSQFIAPYLQAASENAFALLVGTALAVLFAAAMAHQVARSLSRLAEGADDLAAGRLKTRLADAGDDEIASVARSFNSMAASLDRTLHRLARSEAVAATGEFSARLAHEVRNPLTSIRIDVQRLQMRAGTDTDGTASRLLAQLDRLDSFVGATLASAKQVREQQQRTDLTTPLANAAHSAMPHFSAARTTLALDLGARPLWSRVDAAAIEHAALNLLINAAQASGPGGSAALRASERNGEIVVEVEDDGPGLSPEARARAFEPLFTTKADGSGLGLPIAQEIAEENGGVLELAPAPQGGLIARLILPASA